MKHFFDRITLSRETLFDYFMNVHVYNVEVLSFFLQCDVYIIWMSNSLFEIDYWWLRKWFYLSSLTKKQISLKLKSYPPFNKPLPVSFFFGFFFFCKDCFLTAFQQSWNNKKWNLCQGQQMNKLHQHVNKDSFITKKVKIIQN